jgi:NTE family protein
MHSMQDNMQSVRSRDLPGQVVLVLQGGGALGSYQAGVYQALMRLGSNQTGSSAPQSARSMPA